MKFFKFTLLTSTLLLSLNCDALPTIDHEKLQAAKMSIELEEQRAAAKRNPKANEIGNYCQRLAKFRLSGFSIEITDKRVPKDDKIEGDYTVVGKAHNESEDLNFKCKVNLDKDNKKQLLEFKIFRVEAKQ